VVPYVRGREIHRSIDEIVQEITGLARIGYREVTLLGQNVNSYRWRDLSFADLLKIVNRIDGIRRVRFVTSHPKDVSEDLAHAIADLDKVCEHIHLPAQSGSDQILERMNRRYTREDYLGIVSNLRQLVPDIAITTDLMVGFPGETNNDFEKTLSLVEEVRFDYAFCYRYSERPGTRAIMMEDRVEGSVKRERLERLIGITTDISLARNKEMVGDVAEVLVEGVNPRRADQLSGRTRTNKLMFFDGDTIEIGRLVKTRVVEGSSWFLRGERNW
jgi:tRNA-2-methylthio-N6-dimethylallyladenosine synthase